MICPTVETERLILRPFSEDDVEDYFRIHDAPEVRASLHIPDGFDRYQAWVQMAMFLGQWALRRSGNWAVEEKQTGKMVGRAGPHRPARPDWPGLEIGWTFHPSVWGRGFATEAGRAAVSWAFRNHDVDELVSVILPSNTASQAVARRLGYGPGEETTLSFLPDQPVCVWVLPRTRWEQQRADATTR